MADKKRNKKIKKNKIQKKIQQQQHDTALFHFLCCRCLLSEGDHICQVTDWSCVLLERFLAINDKRKRQKVCVASLFLCQLSACSLSIIITLNIDHTQTPEQAAACLSVSAQTKTIKRKVCEREDMCVWISTSLTSLRRLSPQRPTGSVGQRSTKGQ